MKGTIFYFNGVLIVMMTMLSGCYQTAREYNTSLDSGSGKMLAPSYGLITPQAIVDSMTNPTALALPASNESPTDIRNRRIDLGDADPANRVAANPKASAGKFKIILENYINACSDSVGFGTTPSAGQMAARTRLFPGGTTVTAASFDGLYLTFLGRLPTDAERGVLMELSAAVSGNVAWASACAAVLSSMEALNGT